MTGFDFVGGEKGISDKEHLPYKHFMLFGKAIQNSRAVSRVKLSGASDIESAALVGEDTAYVILINKHGQRHTVEAPTLIRSGKAIQANLTTAVQLTHRADMPLSEAMQDTERCERVELPASQIGPIDLPPYCITRLEFRLSE